MPPTQDISKLISLQQNILMKGLWFQSKFRRLSSKMLEIVGYQPSTPFRALLGRSLPKNLLFDSSTRHFVVSTFKRSMVVKNLYQLEIGDLVRLMVICSISSFYSGLQLLLLDAVLIIFLLMTNEPSKFLK